MLEKGWYEEWEQYVGWYGGSWNGAKPRPGPVANGKLCKYLESKSCRSFPCLNSKEFVLCSLDVWKQFIVWYGGGPLILVRIKSGMCVSYHEDEKKTVFNCHSFHYMDTNSLPKDLICQHSSLPFYNPVVHRYFHITNLILIECVQHSVCKSLMCSNYPCPSCPPNQEILEKDLVVAPLFVDTILNQLKVRCTKCDVEPMTRDKFIHQHQYECDDYTCPNQSWGCTHHGKRLTLPQHWMDECPFQPIKCQGSHGTDSHSKCEWIGLRRFYLDHAPHCVDSSPSLMSFAGRAQLFPKVRLDAPSVPNGGMSTSLPLS